MIRQILTIVIAATALMSCRGSEVEVPGPVKLSGTLVMPAGGRAPRAALVLVSGSGPQDRDETLLGHKPFRTIADTLAAHGYATLRYDDRGTGASGGDFASATTADFLADARAAMAYLRQQVPGGTPVGFLGHSEGGEIAFRAAAQDADKPDFIVTLAAPGLVGDSLILSQAETILKLQGLSEGQWQQLVPQLRRRYDSLKGPVPSALLKPLLYAQVVADNPGAALASDKVMEELDTMLTPWYRDMLRYDPRGDIQAVAVPWLALNGSRDTQVLPLNLQRIKELNPRADTLLLPDHNHLFQTCRSGLPEEYESLPAAISPITTGAIVEWLDSIPEPK